MNALLFAEFQSLKNIFTTIAINIATTYTRLDFSNGLKLFIFI